MTEDRSLSARLVEVLDPRSDFNFRHFRMRHMAAELLRAARSDGVLPGKEAPDFHLETTQGGGFGFATYAGSRSCFTLSATPDR